MRKFICIIGMILYLPLMLMIASRITGHSLDTPLLGYTDTAEKPELSVGSFWTSEFQNGFVNWIAQVIKPRGYLIKTYATFRYNCFNLGNRPLGYEHDVFEMPYINGELVINGTKDLADSDNQAEMEDYVRKLSFLNKKLADMDKSLFVYVAANKADFHRDKILKKYSNISDEKSVKPIDYFESLSKETDVPIFITRDWKDKLEYPAFYNSGIHWSRPYEQEISAYIVDQLSSLTGKKYRKIILGDIKNSSTPYFRDTDVFDLLNVWNRPNETFYEYEYCFDNSVDDFDHMRLLIQGDSFAEGFCHDILELSQDEYICFINRNQLITENWGQYDKYITVDSLEEIDIKGYLDNVDAVVIELDEAELTSYSYGFVDYLLDNLSAE